METCETCKANKVCDHNKYGFENCGNYIPDVTMGTRYIDAEKIKITVSQGINCDGIIFIPMKDVHASIDRTPTADVVEVVRCKDCEKYKTPRCAMWYDCEKCGGQWDWCNPHDFCSYGEKKEADDNER